jgi:hypothetical protein
MRSARDWNATGGGCGRAVNAFLGLRSNLPALSTDPGPFGHCSRRVRACSRTGWCGRRLGRFALPLLPAAGTIPCVPKARRTSAVLTGLAFAAGWAYRQAFPRTACPRCGNRAWRRLGGGLKQCRACSYKFYAQLPASKPHGS